MADVACAIFARDLGLNVFAEDVRYPLHEITSSGLNQFHAKPNEPGPLRLGSMYGDVNFGTVEIDWGDGRIGLSVRGLSGEPVRAAATSIAQLAGS